MDAACALTHDRLLAQARDPSSNLTHAFAGVLVRFRTLGLERGELLRLLARFFPGEAGLVDALPAANEGCPAFRADELADLRELLHEHRSDDSEETAWLAHAMATACLGANHLWQDMGLPERAALSELLQRHFTTLAARNTGNMKWKKFFYKQLCERAEVNLCKAPSCQVCTDFAQCFGPES
jgi:nitrogen fixation protein NifQ